MKFGKDLFLNWLRSKDDREQIGFSRMGSSCPIAVCIREVMDAKYVYASPTIIAFERKGSGREYHTPQWAKEFMQRIDEADGGYHDSLPVTAAKALSAMKGL